MANMKVAIVSGFRTPFVKASGPMDGLFAQDLGQIVVRELLERTNIHPQEVDEVVFGNVSCPANAANIARVIALKAGLPIGVSAQTVARNCASGLQSLATGYELIKNNSANIVIAGGTESMSNIPLLFPKSFANFLNQWMRAKSPFEKLKVLSAFRLSMIKPIIGLLEGLTDPFCGLNMGQTAEVLAKEFNISRQAQDEFALASHQKASLAMKNKRFEKEIVPVFSHLIKEPIVQDVGPRPDQTIAALSKLKPFFDRQYGSVTVGNSCPITDGAAAVILMSESEVLKRNIQPLAWIRSYAFYGVDPKRMGLGPVPASSLALQRAGVSLKDLGLIEINEAFAAQVLSVLECFKNKTAAQSLGASDNLSELDHSMLNVNGGAIALGHPVGTSGTRIALTLAIEMQIRKIDLGLATLCIGGGQGGAMVLERA